jgi:hypothetical protein
VHPGVGLETRGLADREQRGRGHRRDRTDYGAGGRSQRRPRRRGHHRLPGRQPQRPQHPQVDGGRRRVPGDGLAEQHHRGHQGGQRERQQGIALENRHLFLFPRLRGHVDEVDVGAAGQLRKRPLEGGQAGPAVGQPDEGVHDGAVLGTHQVGPVLRGERGGRDNFS